MMYCVRYTTVNSKWAVEQRERAFKTAEARDHFLDRENNGVVEILGYSEEPD
jgi:hypothetical protein